MASPYYRCIDKLCLPGWRALINMLVLALVVGSCGRPEIVRWSDSIPCQPVDSLTLRISTYVDDYNFEKRNWRLYHVNLESGFKGDEVAIYLNATRVFEGIVESGNSTESWTGVGVSFTKYGSYKTFIYDKYSHLTGIDDEPLTTSSWIAGERDVDSIFFCMNGQRVAAPLREDYPYLGVHIGMHINEWLKPLPERLMKVPMPIGRLVDSGYVTASPEVTLVYFQYRQPGF